MDRYGTGQDPYCYPETQVLRNRLGITDAGTLAQLERELTQVAANELELHPPPYNLSRLQSIHHHLFGDIYDWAGMVRTIDLSKGETRFCTASRVQPEASRLFGELANESWLLTLDRQHFIERVAVFYGDLNMIHPFREGNGRTQRLLFEQLIINAGYPIDWWQVGPDEWLEANIQAVVCNYAPLTKLFNRCISDDVII